MIAGLRYPGRPGDGWEGSPVPMTYASYAGNLGPLVYYTNAVGDANSMAQMNGIFSYIGGIAGDGRPSVSPTRSGRRSPTGPATPFLFGEHAHARISATGPNAGDVYGANWWTSGDYGDTTASSFFPPNYFQTNEDGVQAPDLLPARRQLQHDLREHAPGRGELRVLRRLGQVPQEHGQLVEPAGDPVQQAELYPQRRRPPASTRPSRPATAARSSAAMASDRPPTPDPLSLAPPMPRRSERPRGDTSPSHPIPSGKRPRRPRSSPRTSRGSRAAGDPADLAVERAPRGSDPENRRAPSERIVRS